MAIWSFNEQGDENSASLDSPVNPPSLDVSESPTTPRLEISDIDAVPFSETFVELFEGLGLHMSTQPSKHGHLVNPDFSYDIENFTDLKEIVPEWQHDEIDEIVVMSSKRPSALPTILEDHSELNSISTAVLSDFAFEISDLMPRTDRSTTSQLCVRRDTGKKYIIKSRRAAAGSLWLERTILEALTELSVPFVPYMRWIFHEGEHMYLVSDHYPGGSLLALVNKHGSLGSHRVVFYASELVAAISSLHSAGIVHRDLEPQNIVFDSEGHLVITGFGCADFVSSTESQAGSSMDHFNGMAGYQAPEILLRWAHNSAVDCWSFGMLLYFMLFGANPIGKGQSTEDDSYMCDRIIRSCIPLESLRLISPMARDLILKCLERNPVVRWNMDKIKTHPYFALVDWQQVSSKRLEVPVFTVPSVAVDRTNVSEAHRRHMSLNPAFTDGEHHISSCSNMTLGRAHSIKGAAGPSSRQDAPFLPELFKPVIKAIIPRVVPEDDDQILEFESVEQPRANLSEDLDPMERMSRFWDNLDKEERASVVSVASLEFGEAKGVKAPKLRKHRSSIHPHHRLFSISTTSFHNKLRKKPRSTGALRQPKPIEPIENLPLGIHQMGSGIGFTYNMPTAVPSKLSVCSFTPVACHNMFHAGFSVLNLGLGLGHSSRKARAKSASVVSISLPSPPLNDGPPDLILDLATELKLEPRSREVGNGTFIRDMYRTPSWLLSPPDSVPSPLALVNNDNNSESSLSPLSDSAGALSPATLVEAEEAEEVNIIIPKSLGIEYDFPDGGLVNSSMRTLRLVPPTARSAFGLSFGGDGDGDGSLATDFLDM